MYVCMYIYIYIYITGTHTIYLSIYLSQVLVVSAKLVLVQITGDGPLHWSIVTPPTITGSGGEQPSKPPGSDAALRLERAALERANRGSSPPPHTQLRCHRHYSACVLARGLRRRVYRDSPWQRDALLARKEARLGRIVRRTTKNTIHDNDKHINQYKIHR